MKRISFIILGLLIGQQTFACIQASTDQSVTVCPGDIVFKGSKYRQGATVKGVNWNKNTVTVKSNVSGHVFEEDVFSLDLSRGCLGEICAGDKVYNGNKYENGAIVKGINLNEKAVTVKSLVSGDVFKESADTLDVTKGCLFAVCVGDTVYKGSKFGNGAIVKGINFAEQTVTVRSVASGHLFVVDPKELDIQNACIDYDDQARRNSMSLN